MNTEIAHRLKSRREELGLTLQEASLATKINPRILEAIEENRQDALPPRTFLRGFVQSYAQYLKLPSADILEQIQPAKTTGPSISATPGATNSSAGMDHPLAGVPTRSKLTPIVSGLVAVVLVVSIFGLLRTIEKYQAESEPQPVEGVEVLADNSLSTSIPVAEPNTPIPTPEPPPGTTASSVASPPPPVPPAEAKLETKPDIKTEKISPSPPKSEVKPADTSPAVAATPNPAPSANLETPASPPAPDTPQEVILEAVDTVDVEYQIDDGPRARASLAPDEIKTLKAKKSLYLRISDGGSVRLIHNGRDRGAPGALGKPVTLVYPKKAP